MPLLERINVKKSWSFNEPVCNLLSVNEQELNAKVFTDNKEAWISNGPSLCAVQIPSGDPRSIWDFGIPLKDSMDVTCVEELPLDYYGRSKFLLAGTSSEKNSQLCFLNLNTYLIFRSVNLPFQVRCTSIIDDGLGCVHPLPDVLGKMQGIVALGGADGSVILMDLNRSHVVPGPKRSATMTSGVNSKPRRCKVVPARFDDADGYFNELKEFQSNGDSLAVSLLVGHGNDGVTCLQYSKLTSTLYVGFSSGIWQIWNIPTFELLYENVDVDLPVFSFCEMEPCDDPDATIYLWVSYQSASNPHPFMAFHTTVYNSKYHVQDYGVYYKDFVNCAQNFSINIQDEISNCVGSKLISCDTLAKSVPKESIFNVGLPPSEDGQCRLFIAAFNAYGGRKSSSTWLCVFDLEQWYREQLPKDIRHDNYFLEWIEIYPEELLTVKVIPDSIRLPSIEEPQEIHLIPEALNFDIVAINREGVISMEKVGRQSRWLRNVNFLGARCLLHPDKLYQSCVAAGFIPQYESVVDTFASTEEHKRRYLLSVCLEQGMKSIIFEAADLWSDGHFTVKNCTLRFLLDWLWTTLQSCFKLFNKKCETLFSAPGYEIDDRMKRSLHSSEVTVRLIESLYAEIVKKHGLKIWADSPEQRLSAMSLIKLVIGQTTWFLNCGLLPEANSEGLPRSSPVFNYDAISRYSKKRREHLWDLLSKKRLLGDGPVVPPPCGLYLADSLLTVSPNSAYSQWEIEGGSASYPPPSLQSLLRTCTIVNIPESDKKSVIYYAVLDYASHLDGKKFSSLSERIFSFECLPRITTRKAKIIKGFWLIDHGQYEEGVKLLLDESILGGDLTEDQHRAVVRVLFLEKESKLALHYLKVRGPQTYQLDDLKLELSLLLTNTDLVDHAFQFVRQHSKFKRELLTQFFAGCVETKEINQVFNFHMDSFEMEVLESFLSSKKGQLYEDLHVLLLLSRSKYTDAITLHEKYSQNGYPKDPLKFDTRDTIIKGITSSLCDVTIREARLANNPNLMNLPETKGLKRNKPPSVYLKFTRENGFVNFKYNADQVMAVSLAYSKLFNRGDEREDPEKKITDDVPMPLTGSLREASSVPARKRHGPVVEPRSVKRARLDPPSTSQEQAQADCKVSDEVSHDISALLDMPLVRRRSKEIYSTPHRGEGPPSSILKSGKTPQTPCRATASDAVENETPRKTLRWNIPADIPKETLISSVKKSLVPREMKSSSEALVKNPSEDEKTLSEPSQSPDSIRERLRPRKSQESPVLVRKAILEDNWQAVEETTIEKPLFAVTLPEKKKIILNPQANEESFIDRLQKLSEAKKVEVEEMDVDEDKVPDVDLSVTIDRSELSVLCERPEESLDTTELGRTAHEQLLGKNEEDEGHALEASVEKSDEFEEEGGVADQIQIRHAVSLSQVQHREEDDDDGSEDPEEAEIPPVIEFFPPEEGLVVNPKYHENVEDPTSDALDDDEAIYDDMVEFEAQQAVVSEQESNDKADSDDSSVIICLSDSDKSAGDSAGDDSAEDDSNSSEEVVRGNRSFFHDKFNADPVEFEDESEEQLELKWDNADVEEEEIEEEEDRDEGLDVQESVENEAVQSVPEEPETHRTELPAIPEEDDEVQTATASLLAIAEEVEVSEASPEPEPQQLAAKWEAAMDKPETLDLVNLNKGQMFFGSPDMLKSTTNSDLATFQIAPGSNLPPPSPEPIELEISSKEETVEFDTKEENDTPDPVNDGFIADKILATPHPASSTRRQSLRLLMRQTPGRQIVPDEEVVESDRSLDVAVLVESSVSVPRVVDESVLAVKTPAAEADRKKVRRRQSSEPPELLSRGPLLKRVRRASSTGPSDEVTSPPIAEGARRRRQRSSSKEPVDVKKEKRSRRSVSRSSEDARSTSSVDLGKRTSRKSEERSSVRTSKSETGGAESTEGRKKTKSRRSTTEPLDGRKVQPEVASPRKDGASTSRGASSRKRAMSLHEYPATTRSRRPTALASIQEDVEEVDKPPAPKRRVTRSMADGEGGRSKAAGRSSLSNLPPSALDINKWLQFHKSQETRRLKRGESSTASQQSSPRRSSRRISAHNIQLNLLYNKLAEEDEDLIAAQSPTKSSVTSIASSKRSTRRRPSSRNSLAEEAASPITTPITSMTQEEKEQAFEEHSQQRIMTRKQTTFLQRCLGLDSPSTSQTPGTPSRGPKEDEDTPKTSRKK